MLSFIARVTAYTWRYGARRISKVVAWIRKNWGRVSGWLKDGVNVVTIIEKILNIIGQ